MHNDTAKLTTNPSNRLSSAGNSPHKADISLVKKLAIVVAVLVMVVVMMKVTLLLLSSAGVALVVVIVSVVGVLLVDGGGGDAAAGGWIIFQHVLIPKSRILQTINVIICVIQICLGVFPQTKRSVECGGG